MGATEERIYHDTRAKDIDIDSLLVHETFEAATAPENRFILSLLGDMNGKEILDLGCGAGEGAVYFALQGAEVIGLDVSPEMVRVGEKLAEKNGVNVKWVTTDATRLPFEDGAFDVIYGNGVLHHLAETKASLFEIKRTMKVGGTAIFIEPLAHNPIINIYRRIAKEVRTADEKPFKIKELEALFKDIFDNCKHEEFWFSTLWLFMRFYLIERVDPNKERYWKKIIQEGQRLSPLYNKLEKIDHKLLTFCPFLKRYCWNTVIFATKH